MENQVRKSLLNNFGAYFQIIGGLVSVKRRKFRVHQLETKQIMDRILEIKNRHPELSKYLNKIPEFRSKANDSENRLADIRKYNVSLLELLDKYELESNKSGWFI